MAFKRSDRRVAGRKTAGGSGDFFSQGAIRYLADTFIRKIPGY
jgi:hypothetical protein